MDLLGQAMMLPVQTPPDTPDWNAQLTHLRQELAALRVDVSRIATALGAALESNSRLQGQLTAAETARADLLAQTAQVIEMLHLARVELRTVADSNR